MLTKVDAFTKKTPTYAIPNIQTVTKITCLQDWITNNGISQSILIDNSKDFTSHLFNALTQAFNIKC